MYILICIYWYVYIIYKLYKYKYNLVSVYIYTYLISRKMQYIPDLLIHSIHFGIATAHALAYHGVQDVDPVSTEKQPRDKQDGLSLCLEHGLKRWV